MPHLESVLVAHGPSHSLWLRARPMSDVLVIIPTYNEAESLPLALEGILQSEPRADVLVVDDGSPTAPGPSPTAGAAHGQGPGDASARKAGLGKAYLAGFAWALERPYPTSARWTPISPTIRRRSPRLVDQAVQGCDLVLGSRWVKGGSTENWEAWRILLSKSGSLYAGRSWVSRSGISPRDFAATAGRPCWAWTWQRWERGLRLPDRAAFRAVRKGFRVCEVPIRFANRRAGVSKLSGGIVGEAVLCRGACDCRDNPRGGEHGGSVMIAGAAGPWVGPLPCVSLLTGGACFSWTAMPRSWLPPIPRPIPHPPERRDRPHRRGLGDHVSRTPSRPGPRRGGYAGSSFLHPVSGLEALLKANLFSAEATLTAVLPG